MISSICLKKYTSATVFLVLMVGMNSYSQNAGIGTTTPQKKLTVNGSILVDQTNKNFGTLDSASLVFGSSGTVGISSKKIGASGLNGMQFWTGGSINLGISSDGKVGVGGNYSDSYQFKVHGGHSHFDANIYSDGSIRALGTGALGGPVDPAYRLRVYNGHTRLEGDVHSTGNAAFGGDVDPIYRLRVYGGNTRFGGDMHATGYVAFGGAVDPTYRLRVYDGNSRFGGDAQVTGTLNTTDMNVTNNFTIKGTGSVRSEGVSPLRIGFEQISINNWVNFDPYEKIDFTVNLSDFSSTGDVRVMFAGYNPTNDAALMFSQRFRFQVISINSVANTVTLQAFNDSDASSELLGTIYLLAVIKDN